MLFDRLAADLRNLTLKAPYTGLAGVVTNDVADRIDRKFDLAFFQAVGRNLLGREVFDGDVDLLVFGVTRSRTTISTTITWKSTTTCPT
jgi:hypothetical protein